jgi:hypothetical protein
VEDIELGPFIGKEKRKAKVSEASTGGIEAIHINCK